MILDVLRCAKKGEDAVSDYFIYDSAVIQDDFDHFPEVAIEKLDDLFRTHARRKGREASQVRHHNGDFSDFAAQLEPVFGFEETFHDFLGEVSAECVLDAL